MGSKNKDTTKKTSIGGQALIEGIMMKGVSKGAMAVRLPDGSIDVEDWDIKPKKWYNKCPVIRGSINFVQQLREGYSCLMKSADKSGMMDDDSEEEQSKFEKWLDDKFGDKLTGAIMAIAMVIGIALAVFLFLLLPSYIFTGIEALLPTEPMNALSGLLPGLPEGSYVMVKSVDISGWRTVFEGVMKIVIFVAYMWVTSLTKDMHRMYRYHGAEHKTIACYEKGLPLTVDNVRSCIRFHPRCGTSFLFMVMIISILFFSLFSWSNPWVRMALRLAMLPVVAGVSYEINRFAGRYDNWLTILLRKPGLALQRLTTAEPTDDMIEVGIEAMKRVIPENENEDRW